MHGDSPFPPFPPLEAYEADEATAIRVVGGTAARARSVRVPLMDVVDAPSLAGIPVPERRWIVPGWIPQGSVTLLGGDGGVGKSLIALQLMIASALGRQWLGLDVARMKSFGMFCEDDGPEVHIRAAAICAGLHAGLENLDGVCWSARSGMDNILFSCPRHGEWHATRVWRDLEERVLDSGAQIVVIDTAADTFGGEENFRAQVRAYINLLRGLAQRIDGAVILSAHPSNAGMQTGSGLSGSTAWSNSVRSRLYLTREKRGEGDEAREDENVRVLKRMKSNYASINDQVRMTWENGLFIAEHAPGSLDRRVREQQVEDAFLRGLRLLTSRGMNLSPSRSSTYAPAQIANVIPGFRRAELDRAMNSLLAKGRLRVITTGSPSRQRSRLVEDDVGASG